MTEPPRTEETPTAYIARLEATINAHLQLLAEAREALAVCGALIVAEQFAPPIHNFEIEARRAARAKCEEIISAVLAKLKAASGP